MTEEEIKFFDNLAPVWDSNEIKSTPAKISKILEVAGIRKGDHVLDLGTGTGVLIPQILEYIGEEGLLKAVDASTGMLDKAKEKFGTVGMNLSFELKDFETEDIEGRYNLIILYSVYPHLNNPLTTLRRIRERNLADGGKIVIAFPASEDFINNIHGERKAPGDALPPSEELARRLREAGLKAFHVPFEEEIYMVIVE